MSTTPSPPSSSLFPYTTLFRSHHLRLVLLLDRVGGDGHGRVDLLLDHLGVVVLEGPQLGHLLLARSEEHTSELQSRGHLVCRLLLEKKKRTSARVAGGPAAGSR